MFFEPDIIQLGILEIIAFIVGICVGYIIATVKD